MFEVRAAAEPLVAGERPDPVLVYVPGVSPEAAESVLAELEMAGYRYETQLKRLARNLLRQQYTDGVIDDLLERDGVTYDDIARFAEPGGDQEPSILKGIYPDYPARDDMLAAWLASDDRDETIASKAAVEELVRLVESRTGLELDPADSLAKLRAIAARYVLVGEFRGDLAGPAPSAHRGDPGAPDEGRDRGRERSRGSSADAPRRGVCRSRRPTRSGAGLGDGRSSGGGARRDRHVPVRGARAAWSRWRADR